LKPGDVGTENDQPAAVAHARVHNARVALDYANKGVRSSVVRLSPTVHGDGDHGFMPLIIDAARKSGVSAYVGDGTSRWSAVHRFDAATLYRLVVEKAEAGTIWHGVAEEGIQIREIAEAIGRQLDVPVKSITPEEANDHFGFLGAFLTLDSPASSMITQEKLGWKPTHQGLIADLDEGHYFDKK
jgi:nucleoside-diphosphate-sugar epimerase